MGREFSPNQVRPVRPIPRRPPRRNEREKKTLTRSKQFAIGLFKALDVVSEWSEIIDAFYETLPTTTKNRWEGKKNPWWAYDAIVPEQRKSRGLLDKAGQYGIDGADWKLQALWYNWHKVDAEAAMRNVINNVAQDQIIGLLQKNLPKNNGHAFDDAMQQINRTLEEHLFI